MRTPDFRQLPCDRPAIDELEVSVFGSCPGEAVVLHLGGDRWAAIDCCAVNIPKKDPVCLPLKYLGQLRDGDGERPVTELEFVAYTHPHEDHMRGLDCLIRSMSRIGTVWSPAGNWRSIFGEMSRIAEKQNLDLDIGRAAKLVGTIDEAYEYARDYLNAKRELFVGRQQVWPPLSTDLTHVDSEQPQGDASLPVQVHGIAPDAEDINTVQRTVSRILVKAAHQEVIEAVPKIDSRGGFLWNLLSAALSVECGSTMIILGGDVPAGDNKIRGWQSLADSGLLAAQLVKVAHHGSEDSYCEAAWAQHASGKNGKPVSVLTPFLQAGEPICDRMSIVTSSRVAYCTGPCPGCLDSHLTVEELDDLTDEDQVVDQYADWGMVRVRMRPQQPARISLFGRARQLST